VEWVNEWGLSQSQTAELRAPKRLS
jgi:hypothetical protein